MSQLLHFKQQGQGQDIILIHGLFGSLDNLNMIAKPLSNHFKTTNIDVRNHGNSFHHHQVDYPTMAQDIINVMNELSIDSAHVIGHSMGGKIAMQLALEHSDRVNKLIVADIAPVKYPAHHNQIIEGLKAVDNAEITSRKEADAILSQYEQTPSVRQFLLRNLVTKSDALSLKCHVNYIAEGYEKIMQAITSTDSFHGETLFVKGGNSDYITQAHRDKITPLFPLAKAKVIQGAGHWLHAEKTTAFNKVVLDFLRGC